MCWRLFVIFFVHVFFFVGWFVVQLWSKSAVVVRTANARYDIIFKRSIKTQTSSTEYKKDATKTAMKNEWMHTSAWQVYDVVEKTQCIECESHSQKINKFLD